MYSISYDFLGCGEKSNYKQKMCARVIKKQIKSSSKEYVGNARKVLDNKNRFPKIIS